jgi:hypothetical protein
MPKPKGYQQLVYHCCECPNVDADYDIRKHEMTYTCSRLIRIVDRINIPEDCPLDDVDI